MRAAADEAEDLSSVNGVKKQDYSAWALSGKYTFGNNALMAVYTDSEIDGVGGGTSKDKLDRGGWGVSAEHNFSKRTKAYVAYADGENELKPSGSANSKDDNSAFSLGMIHNF